MGKKRLLISIFVVILVVSLVVGLAFQIGVDERLLQAVLPRIENKFDVEIEYDGMSASLTALSLDAVKVRSKSTGRTFITIDRLVINIRVGPLFFGELDIKSVRIDGLEIRIGEKADGPAVEDWAQLLNNVRRQAPPKAPDPKKSRPTIHLTSGKVILDEGRLSAMLSGLEGQIDAGKDSALEAENYQIKHDGLKIVQGSQAQIKYINSTKKVEIRLSPKLQLPANRYRVGLLGLDIAQLARNSTPIQKDNKEPQSTNPSKSFGGIKTEISNASLEFIEPEHADHRFKLDEINASITMSTQDNFSMWATGKADGSSEPWKMSSSISNETSEFTVDIKNLSLGAVSSVLNPMTHLELAKAHANCSVKIGLKEEKIAASGNVSVTGLTIDHDRIAKTPIQDFQMGGDFELDLNIAEKTIHFKRLHLSRGMARATVQGVLHLDRLAFDLSVQVPPTPCRQILGAFPSELRPKLDNLELDGQIGLDIHLNIDEQIPEATQLKVNMDNRCRVTKFGDVPAPSYFYGPFSYMAYTEDDSPLRMMTGPGTGRWVPMVLISPYVIEAVLTTEDGKFWRHKGITIPEVRKAIELNLKKGSFRHGASTLTMQLAKNLFLSRERTISRKLQELFFVWYLESNFKKEELLELYLNIVEFGPSLYGIGDAAEHYFGREASELNAIESVFLIKLLPNPVARHRSYARNKVSDQQMRSYHRVLKTMKERGRLTDFEYNEALQQKIVFHQEGTPAPPPRQPVRASGNLEEEPADDTYEDTDI